MPFFTYILKCIDCNNSPSFYTGSTNDLSGRVRAHATGRGAIYTRSRSVKLVYYERFSTRADAMKRERAIKRMNLKRKTELVETGPGVKVASQ